MNIKKSLKNILAASALFIALSVGNETFAQSTPPAGGKIKLHESNQGMEVFANNDGSFNNEGIDFYVGGGTSSSFPRKLGLRVDFNGHVNVPQALHTSSIVGLRNPGYLRLAAYADGGIRESESFYVLRSGKVGVGTLNPEEKLDVRGTVKASLVKTNMVQEIERMYATSNGLTLLVPGTRHFYFRSDAKLGIGVRNPGVALDVNGDGKFSGSLSASRVSLSVGSFPDYVFGKDYDLMPLEQVEAYIKANQHLPKVPSAAKVIKEGMNVGQINVLLMEKVEELTLHAIAQNKQIKQLLKEVKALKAQVKK